MYVSVPVKENDPHSIGLKYFRFSDFLAAPLFYPCLGADEVQSINVFCVPEYHGSPCRHNPTSWHPVRHKETICRYTGNRPSGPPDATFTYCPLASPLDNHIPRAEFPARKSTGRIWPSAVQHSERVNAFALTTAPELVHAVWVDLRRPQLTACVNYGTSRPALDFSIVTWNSRL